MPNSVGRRTSNSSHGAASLFARCSARSCTPARYTAKQIGRCGALILVRAYLHRHARFGRQQLEALRL
jgi:hypothetical protein